MIKNDYLTIYRKDYISKKLSKSSIQRNKIYQEFRDPITEGFKHYLELDKTENMQPPKENGISYMENINERYQKVGKMNFANGIDSNAILKKNLNNKQTKYQTDYCDLEHMRKVVKTTVTLPEYYAIPLTTQKLSYRSPVVIKPNVYNPVEIVKPRNNLGQDEKINKILNIKTGNSEYMRVIGKLGNYIVNEQLHGKLYHLPFTAAD